ncbi:3-oxoacyl-[acyl-carrier-protein] synthase III C-terminal domain-containing protein [Streptomyces aidingensis]|uniref:3-oxoacyl-[acyl-carrier-protein] synthase-3 n=1 Tax=Streptomyces aidingensis TaxID=910347 RepID=A0A1I1N0Y3_9ACTN|nr:3-oxoacyl-[acyl-carrier-protein] synthase III C-terminal domain-containing protein [Streptomyces aidingensis]SFC88503.1 3-oxoacyl-[acyl-carrier-protein] synthase-3 [Streptomyces aidingensis]
MSTGVGLERVAVRLPGRVEKVADIMRRTGHDPAESRLFKTLFGLRHSPSLAPGEQWEDLLTAAGREALGGGHASLVLYGHTLLTQEFALRGGFADRMRARLGLPGSRFFGLSHINCVSVLRGVELARRYLRRPGVSPDDRVLILGGDHASVHDASRVMPGMAVGGDGVIAVAVRPHGRARYRYLGGAASRDARFHRKDLSADRAVLFSQICREQAVDTALRAVRDAGLTPADIDWVMPHLSNRMFWSTFGRLTGIPRDRICTDLIPERGHNFGGDALMALEHAESTGRLRPGHRCVLLSLALGAYFQAVIVEVEED